MSRRARLASPRLRSLHIKGGVATRISAHAVGLVLLFSSVPLAAQDNTPPAGTAAPARDAAVTYLNVFIADTLRKWNVPGGRGLGRVLRLPSGRRGWVIGS